jgi:hypothetical protein
METATELKWYDKTWLIVLLCLLFWPVGIYGLWKSDVHSQGMKIGLTVLVVVMTIAYIVAQVMDTSSAAIQ